MRRSALKRGGLLTAAAVMSANVGAAEVVLTFGLEQRLETGRNVDLTVPEGGQTTTSATRLSFGAVSRTGLDLLEFTAATSLEVENSEDSGSTETDLASPDIGLRYTREVPNSLFSIGAQYRQDDVDAFEDDLADADLGGTRTDIGADLRIETGRTAPIGLAFTTSFSRSEYEDTTDPELIDTDTLRVGIETVLRFSDIMQARIGLGYEREEETEIVGPAIETVLGSLGLTYTLANGTATADLIFSSEDEAGDRTTFVIGRSLTLPASTLSARLGVTNGDTGGTELIGAVAWSQELPRGALDLLLEQRVAVEDAEAETVTAFSIELAQEVNEVSALGLSLSHEISDAPSERIELSEFAATYSYQLTPDWELDSGVRYRIRNDADGRSESPDVFVALSRSFEFRP